MTEKHNNIKSQEEGGFAPVSISPEIMLLKKKFPDSFDKIWYWSKPYDTPIIKKIKNIIKTWQDLIEIKENNNKEENILDDLKLIRDITNLKDLFIPKMFIFCANYGYGKSACLSSFISDENNNGFKIKYINFRNLLILEEDKQQEEETNNTDLNLKSLKEKYNEIIKNSKKNILSQIIEMLEIKIYEKSEPNNRFKINTDYLLIDELDELHQMLENISQIKFDNIVNDSKEDNKEILNKIIKYSKEKNKELFKEIILFLLNLERDYGKNEEIQNKPMPWIICSATYKNLDIIYEAGNIVLDHRLFLYPDQEASIFINETMLKKEDLEGFIKNIMGKILNDIINNKEELIKFSNGKPRTIQKILSYYFKNKETTINNKETTDLIEVFKSYIEKEIENVKDKLLDIFKNLIIARNSGVYTKEDIKILYFIDFNEEKIFDILKKWIKNRIINILLSKNNQKNKTNGKNNDDFIQDPIQAIINEYKSFYNQNQNDEIFPLFDDKKKEEFINQFKDEVSRLIDYII